VSIALFCALIEKSSSIQTLVDVLRREIQRLDAGDRLPSSRELVERHRVSPITVSRAIALLAQEGAVESRPGSGTYVSELAAPPAAVDHSWQTITLADRSVDISGVMPLSDSVEEGVLSLGTGYLHSSLQPTRALAAAFAHATRLPEVWDRPPASGLRGLRAWFAASAAPGIDAHDVIITPGGQGAISAAFRALVPAGAPLLVESPTYQGAIAVARMAGIRHVPVPTDAEGIIPDLLTEAFSRTGAQALYLQPTYQNPTGAILSPSRRSAVLGAAAAAGAFVIEDDYARWLSFGRRAPSPLLLDDQEGRVVYITSLTKVASPSLRIGALIARGPVADRLRSIRVVDDMFVPRTTQEAALELVSGNAWNRHLHDLARALAQRSHALADAIMHQMPASQLLSRPQGGMHLWVAIPDDLDDAEVALAARRNGVAVMPGRSFFPAEEAGSHLRLTFTGVPSEADLEEGIRRLVVAVPELAGGPRRGA
jgi:DNA-binding transcriptional MocR family regulator